MPRRLANTTIQTSGYGEGGYGTGGYGGAPLVTMKDGQQDVSFDDCADKLYRYWETLLKPKLE